MTPIGVFDLACLEKILGLYACYRHGSHFRCFFCKTTKHEIYDFEPVTKWKLRDIKEMAEKASIPNVNPIQREGIKVIIINYN